MPDITMCRGEGCKTKQDCYRFKAKPSPMQSYFVYSPRRSDNSCSMHVALQPEERDKKDE